MTTPTTYRQLDQRTADGLAVTLEWNPATDALRIVVVDRESEAVTFPVTRRGRIRCVRPPFHLCRTRGLRGRVMPRQTRLDARYLSKLTAARGQDRLHAGDGVMTHLGPIGRLGRYTATLWTHRGRRPRAADDPSQPELPASPVSGRSARATSTAPTASRCSRSNRWLHLATPPTQTWVVALVSHKRLGRRAPSTARRPRRSNDDRSDRHDPQRRGYRAAVFDAGSDQGPARARQVPVPRHQPLDRRLP